MNFRFIALASTDTAPETHTAWPPRDGEMTGSLNPAVLGPSTPAGRAPPGFDATGDVGIRFPAAAPATKTRIAERMVNCSLSVEGREWDRKGMKMAARTKAPHIYNLFVQSFGGMRSQLRFGRAAQPLLLIQKTLFGQDVIQEGTNVIGAVVPSCRIWSSRCPM